MGSVLRHENKWSDILKLKLFFYALPQRVKAMLKFCPSPHEIQMLLGFPFNAAGCHTSLLSRHRLSVWSGETRACEPHKGCCWRKLSNSWHKGDIRGQRCGLAAPWALVQVVSSSSGALRSTTFLNRFQSIFLVHPMEQSLRAFPRTYNSSWILL